MLSTGIVALDGRLGGLAAGRYYLVSGAPGSGKTSVAFHFLGAGLEAGERCALLTQDDPQDLVAQADFLGYDFRPAGESGQLVVLQYRLDFAHNLSRVTDPEAVVRELKEMLGGDMPDRFVVDSALPFVEPGGVMQDAGMALTHLLQELGATTYVVVPGDINESFYLPIYNRITAGAAGIFHLEMVEGQIREMSIRKLRQAAVNTEPFRFIVSPGVGVVECAQVRPLAALAEEFQRRVVVLNLGGEMPGDALAALRSMYDLRTYANLGDAFAELLAGNFAVLIVCMDPRDPEPAFSLTRQLRRAGNGAPVLFVSSQQDLRSSTRSKGLRAGGDDFLTDELSAQEFLERVEVSRQRGHRMPSAERAADSVFVQPSDDAGNPVPIDESELRRAVRFQAEQPGHPFFALVLLRPPVYLRDDTWRILADDLRVREGDLVGHLDDGRVAVYLHDISRRNVKELLMRVVSQHPELAGVQDVEVFSYPTDRAAIERWLAQPPVLEEARVEP